MSQWLEQIADLLKSMVEAGEPSLVIAANVLVFGAIIAYVIWRIKSELRGIKWNDLPMADRRRIIEQILTEAMDLAEFLFSHVQPSEDLKAKQKVGDQKRKAAITYAERELHALGAARQDIDTLDLRLEKIFHDQHPGKVRYGPTI